MQRSPLITSDIERKVLDHLKFIKEGVTYLEKLVLNERQGIFEGVAFLLQIEHLFDHLGITLSLVRPDSYVNHLNDMLKSTLEKIKRTNNLVVTPRIGIENSIMRINFDRIESDDIVEINKTWKMFRDHKIGTGAFYKVFKGQNNLTGEVVAVKVLDLERERRNNQEFLKLENVLREVQILFETNQTS